jgi:predicted nucleotidyltransferase
MAKTVGLVEVIREALSPLKDRLAVVFVHGSVATSGERSASDVDLVAIGSAGLAELSLLLEVAEERLGRPVNATVYSDHEFARKLAARNHFLCSVLDKEKLFVVGKPNDLERIAGQKLRRASRHQQARA